MEKMTPLDTDNDILMMVENLRGRKEVYVYVEHGVDEVAEFEVPLNPRMGSVFDDSHDTVNINPNMPNATANTCVEDAVSDQIYMEKSNNSDDYGDFDSNEGRQSWILGIDDIEYVESEYNSDSDVLRSPMRDEEPSSRHYREFNPDTDYTQQKLTMQVHDVFPSAKAFREFLVEYSVQVGFEYKFEKNEKTRIIALCKKNCGWRVRASTNSTLGAFQIKKLDGEHKCLREELKSNVTYKYVAKKYLPNIKDDPNMSSTVMMKDAKRTHQLDVSIQKCLRAKRLCKEILTGSEADQFRRIRDYASIILQTNIGSSAGVSADPDDGHRFESFYCCLAACKKGFIEACRPIISVDGCHLKTKFGGVLLSAVGKDANDNMYPIAWAVVRIENKVNWKWFLECLLKDLGPVEVHGWNFMSDQQKVNVPKL